MSSSKLYPVLAKEWKYQKGYKEAWSGAPFPPTFVTADAIVVCSGHVLVIERKINPGKGLFALPGGFVRQNEFIEHAALRELREETALGADIGSLKRYIVSSKVFDYPTRSERGRTITHGYYLQLPDGPLPSIKGGDDAKRAFWMPLFEAFGSEEKFFEDHLHIINSFVGVQGER
jgi:bifunctional NMN adenylyltransferase/nudix hydrolase